MEHGLVLVDTKYEFGKANDGSILLIDEVNSILEVEALKILNVFNTNNINNVIKFLYLRLQVHTPDSSRYWIADSYMERFENGLEPENIDKVCYM